MTTNEVTQHHVLRWPAQSRTLKVRYISFAASTEVEFNVGATNDLAAKIALLYSFDTGLTSTDRIAVLRGLVLNALANIASGRVTHVFVPVQTGYPDIRMELG